MVNEQLKVAFRSADRRGIYSVIKVLDESRKKASVNRYEEIGSAFRVFATRHAPILLRGGVHNFGDLVWSRPCLSSVGLKGELEWSKTWLKGKAATINGFRSLSLRLQSMFAKGQCEEALSELDLHNTRSGWTIWGLETRVALGQLVNVVAQREWESQLLASAKDSVPGLLLHVFSERNDPSFSYDRFYWKCQNSFPSFSQISEWLPTYLLYRSIGYLDDPEATLSVALARDATSALFDYYETLIDTLKAVANEEALAGIRSVALDVVNNLRDQGIIDNRLAKLSVALGGRFEAVIQECDDETAEFRALLHCIKSGGPVPVTLPGPLKDMLNCLSECREKGLAAGPLSAKLLKDGLNYRAFDFCVAIAMAAQDSVSDLVSRRVSSIDVAMLGTELSVVDLRGFPDEIGLRLAGEFPNGALSASDRALLAHVDFWLGSEQYHGTTRYASTIDAWLARQLVVQDRPTRVQELCAQTIGGDEWRRYASKAQIWAYSRQGEIGAALDLAAAWMVEFPEASSELPVHLIFDGRTWSEFKDQDVILTGLVAHYCYIGKRKAQVSHICKMACRKFFETIRSELSPEFFESLPEARRRCLIAFLREVWVEENLSMTHHLVSTDDVRRDRIEILQLLHALDRERADAYVTAIKELTFQGTLLQGIQHINESRIYVNETAITRWAEKELQEDYERWVNLSGSSLDQQIASELVRRFAVGHQLQEILDVLTAGRPSESHAQLVTLVDRLWKRFLTDPADGLDCYLSLRIRHGSLRGIFFGPLEEYALLLGPSVSSRQEFERRWKTSGPQPACDWSAVEATLDSFAAKLRAHADDLINERIQIRTHEKPRGAISNQIPPAGAALLTTLCVATPPQFGEFLQVCYVYFWRIVEEWMATLADYVRGDFKNSVQRDFDQVISDLRGLGVAGQVLGAMTTVATLTNAQIDLISYWFRPVRDEKSDVFKLAAAVEIATVYMKNVYRAFPANLPSRILPQEDLPLTTLGVGILSDVLFIVLENAWKHSGLGADIDEIELTVSINVDAGILTCLVKNPISEQVHRELARGQLEDLRQKHIGRLPLENANREGGSGFAKLSRYARFVDQITDDVPLDFGLDSGRWFTRVLVPMIRVGGAYEPRQ